MAYLIKTYLIPFQLLNYLVKTTVYIHNYPSWYKTTYNLTRSYVDSSFDTQDFVFGFSRTTETKLPAQLVHIEFETVYVLCKRYC